MVFDAVASAAKKRAIQPKCSVASRLIARYRNDRQTKSGADRFDDFLGGYPGFSDRVHRCTGRRTFEGETNESRRINSVHSGPAVGAVADEA